MQISKMFMPTAVFGAVLSVFAEGEITGGLGDRIVVDAQTSTTQSAAVNLADGAELEKVGGGEYVLPLETVVQRENFMATVRDGKVTVTEGETPETESVPMAILNGAAIWLDAKVNVDEDGNGAVVAWRDCRETKTASPFDYMHGIVHEHGAGGAPNRPAKVVNDRGPAVDFQGYGSCFCLGLAQPNGTYPNTSDIRPTDVFIVHEITRQGWGYLYRGSTATPAYEPGAAAITLNKIYVLSSIRAFWESRWYDNGVLIDPIVAKPQLGAYVTDHKFYNAATLPEINAMFSFNSDDYATRDGGDLLHEVIFFTNRLSEVEHVQVRRYLQRKWNMAPAATALHGFRIAEGTELAADRETGDFGVSGAGAVTTTAGKDVTVGYSTAGAFVGTVEPIRNDAGSLTAKFDAAVTGVAAGDVLLASNTLNGTEYALRTAGGRAGEIVKTGESRAILTEVPADAAAIRVTGGTLAFRSETPDSSVLAGSAVYATITNADFELPIPTSQYYTNMRTTSNSSGWTCTYRPDYSAADSYSIIGNQKDAGTVWLNFPSGVDNTYIALRGDCQILGAAEIPVTGTYELSFDFSDHNAQDHAAIEVLYGPDADNLQVIGSAFTIGRGYGWRRQMVTTPRLEKGKGVLVFRTVTYPTHAGAPWYLDNIKMRLVACSDGAFKIPYGDFESMTPNDIFGNRNALCTQYKFTSATFALEATGWTFVQKSGVTDRTVGLAIDGVGTVSNPYAVSFSDESMDHHGQSQLLIAAPGALAKTTFAAPSGQWQLRADAAAWRKADMTTAVRSKYGDALLKATVVIGGETIDLGTVALPGSNPVVATWDKTIDIPTGGASAELSLEITSAEADAIVDNLVLVPANLVRNGEFATALSATADWTADASRKVPGTVMSAVRVGRSTEVDASANEYVCPQQNYEGGSDRIDVAYIGDCASLYQNVHFQPGRYRLTYYTRSRFNRDASTLIGSRRAGCNWFRSYFAANGVTNVIDEVDVVTSNWVQRTATFAVATEGDYSFGFEGMNVPTVDAVDVVLGSGKDKTGFLDGVSVRRVDSSLGTMSLPEKLKIRVATGSKLRLDFTGTTSVGPVSLGGHTINGEVSAEKYPDYILGEGVLESHPDGMVITIR